MTLDDMTHHDINILEHIFTMPQSNEVYGVWINISQEEHHMYVLPRYAEYITYC